MSQAKDYFFEMEERGRLVKINSLDGESVSILTFFLCNTIDDVKNFYNRPMWSTPDDSPMGGICYIDKLISFEWNRSLRNSVETIIIEKYPSVNLFAWFRPTKTDDRLVLWERKHVTKV